MLKPASAKIGLAFTLIGLPFAAIGFGLAAGDEVHWRDWPKVNAEVVRLDESHADLDSTTYYPVFRFVPPRGGVAVEARSNVGSYPARARVGERLLLAVDPEDPTRVLQRGSSRLLSTIFAGLGTLLTAVGVVLLGAGVARERRGKRARERGEPAFGEVVGIRLVEQVSHFGRHPWVVDVRWTSPSGAEHVFTSEELWTDPSGAVRPGQRVPLRVLAADPDRYHWIDASALTPARAEPRDATRG